MLFKNIVSPGANTLTSSEANTLPTLNPPSSNDEPLDIPDPVASIPTKYRRLSVKLTLVEQTQLTARCARYDMSGSRYVKLLMRIDGMHGLIRKYILSTLKDSPLTTTAAEK